VRHGGHAFQLEFPVVQVPRRRIWKSVATSATLDEEVTPFTDSVERRPGACGLDPFPVQGGLRRSGLAQMEIGTSRATRHEEGGKSDPPAPGACGMGHSDNPSISFASQRGASSESSFNLARPLRLIHPRPAANVRLGPADQVLDFHSIDSSSPSEVE